jgi:hypothetical protein
VGAVPAAAEGRRLVSGLCECGCEQPTRLAPRTDLAKGWVKGRPLRFVRGHQRRGVPHGANFPQFNGGLHVRSTDGRCVIFCRDGSQLLYYRGLMAAQIGRLLLPDEIIHHKNEDPSDDRIENLEVVTRAEHMEIHRADLMAGKAIADA